MLQRLGPPARPVNPGGLSSGLMIFFSSRRLASAGTAPDATVPAGFVLPFALRITASMPAPGHPLHGQVHDCRSKNLSPAIVETGSTTPFGFDSRSRHCKTLHSDSRQTWRYEDHLCWLRPINDIFPFDTVKPCRIVHPRKQTAGFGECLESGAIAP